MNSSLRAFADRLSPASRSRGDSIWRPAFIGVAVRKEACGGRKTLGRAPLRELKIPGTKTPTVHRAKRTSVDSSGTEYYIKKCRMYSGMRPSN
jgi:hypothetical protein